VSRLAPTDRAVAAGDRYRTVRSFAYGAATLTRAMGDDMRIRKCVAVLTLTTGLSVGMAGTAMAADRDCASFASQAEAQAALDDDPTDPDRLDEDGDGQACEDFTYGSNGGGGAMGQVATPPAGGVDTGDGSTAGSDAGPLPFVVGGLGLAAAGGAAFAARRSARGSA